MSYSREPTFVNIVSNSSTTNIFYEQQADQKEPGPMMDDIDPLMVASGFSGLTFADGEDNLRHAVTCIDIKLDILLDKPSGPLSSNRVLVAQELCELKTTYNDMIEVLQEQAVAAATADADDQGFVAKSDPGMITLTPTELAVMIYETFIIRRKRHGGKWYISFNDAALLEGIQSKLLVPVRRGTTELRGHEARQRQYVDKMYPDNLDLYDSAWNAVFRYLHQKTYQEYGLWKATRKPPTE